MQTDAVLPKTEDAAAPFGGVLSFWFPIRPQGRGGRSGKRFSALGRRHYDPTVGRFLEPDSAQWLDPKRFGGINPYAYCLNDPIEKEDPSGRMPILAALFIMGMVGAASAFATQSVSDWLTGQGFDWGRSGIAALAGFVGGVLAATSLPLAPYISAAASSAINTAGQMLRSGRDYSGWDYANGVILSGLAGVASAELIKFARKEACFFRWTSLMSSEYLKSVTRLEGAKMFTGRVAAYFTAALSLRMMALNAATDLLSSPLFLAANSLLDFGHETRRRQAKQEGWAWLW